MKQHNRAEKLFTVAFFLTIANFVGKFLGFLRDILISNYYGATAQTDAFFLALSIPTILIGVFTSSADSSIVPQYSKIAQDEGRETADRYFSNIITLLTVIATVVAVFSLLFPQAIVFVFAPSFQAEQLQMACRYLRFFSFAGLFHIWFCFFCAYLLCYERTTVRIILSLSTNVLVVLSLLFVHDTGMIFLSVAYILGSLLSAMLPMIASVRAGYRYHFVLSVKEHHFPAFFKLFLPIMGSALLADLLLYCDRFLSSFLPAGSLSSLNYASKIISIFDNILVVGVGAVLLPSLTRLQLEDKKDAFRFTVSAVCFCIILVLFPIALLSILYSYNIVSVLYLRGAFTVDNALTVSFVYKAYAMQILFLSMKTILMKVFHSMGDTKFPFKAALITFFLNVFLSVALMQVFGIFGIALATSISTLCGCFILLFRLHKIVGLSKEFFGVRSLLRWAVCVAVMIVPSLLFPAFSSSLVNLLVSGGASAVLYGAASVVLFRRELGQCWKAIRG